MFSLLCSDLRSYRVADAVAASMAVPMIFTPIVLRTWPDHCREPIPLALLNARYDRLEAFLERTKGDDV